MPTADNYQEGDAGIAGGCGACKKCDPEWWQLLRIKELRCAHPNDPRPSEEIFTAAETATRIADSFAPRHPENADLRRQVHAAQWEAWERGRNYGLLKRPPRRPRKGVGR